MLSKYVGGSVTILKLTQISFYSCINAQRHFQQDEFECFQEKRSKTEQQMWVSVPGIESVTFCLRGRSDSDELQERVKSYFKVDLVGRVRGYFVALRCNSWRIELTATTEKSVEWQHKRNTYLVNIGAECHGVGDGVRDLPGNILLLCDIVHHVVYLVHIPVQQIKSCLSTYFTLNIFSVLQIFLIAEWNPHHHNFVCRIPVRITETAELEYQL